MFHALTPRQIPAPKGKRIPSRKVRGHSHRSARAHAKQYGNPSSFIPLIASPAAISRTIGARRSGRRSSGRCRNRRTPCGARAASKRPVRRVVGGRREARLDETGTRSIGPADRSSVQNPKCLGEFIRVPLSHRKRYDFPENYSSDQSKLHGSRLLSLLPAEDGRDAPPGRANRKLSPKSQHGVRTPAEISFHRLHGSLIATNPKIL
jgi:hypothetical protein